MRFGRWVVVTTVVLVVTGIVATRLGDRFHWRRWTGRSATPAAAAEEAPEAESRGRTLYLGACVMCHGERGRGTALAPALADSARDLEAMVRVVQEGAAAAEEHHPPMPPRGDGTWSDADVREVAVYVRSLKR